jgi:hypothetical protein
MLLRIPRPEGCEIEARKTLRQHQRMVVEIGLFTGNPPRELRALLERDVAVAEKVRFRYADLLQGRPHRRPGPLSHADDADGLALNQRNLETAAGFGTVACRYDAGRKPSGRTAADDADRSNRTHHGLFSHQIAAPCNSANDLLNYRNMARHAADVDGKFPGARQPARPEIQVLKIRTRRGSPTSTCVRYLPHRGTGSGNKRTSKYPGWSD